MHTDEQHNTVCKIAISISRPVFKFASQQLENTVCVPEWKYTVIYEKNV